MTNSKEQLEKHQLSQFETWESLKSFYGEKFQISPELVDIAPVLDILRLCASGSSNKSIATFLGETEMGISEIIDVYLGFMGWKEDLHFSPLQYYKNWNNPDMEMFKDEVVFRFGTYHNMDFIHMYNAVVIVSNLERLFDEKWI